MNITQMDSSLGMALSPAVMLLIRDSIFGCEVMIKKDMRMLIMSINLLLKNLDLVEKTTDTMNYQVKLKHVMYNPV